MTDSWNIDKFRALVGSGEAERTRQTGLAGAVLVDEAHVADISMQQMLIDLMSPFRGARSKAEYFGIALFINVAKGEEVTLN